MCKDIAIPDVNYNGPTLELVFKAGTSKECQETGHIIHQTLKGSDDYVDSNIVLTVTDRDVTLTCCLNDIKDEKHFVENLHNIIDNVFPINNKED